MKLLIEQAWLNTLIVLVFAIFAIITVPLKVTFNGMVKNLANFYARINANWMDAKHFKRPIPRKAHVAKTRGNMDK